MNDIELAIINLIDKHKKEISQLEDLQKTLAGVEQEELGDGTDLTFTKQSFGAFKQMYQKAVAEEHDTFIFNDRMFLVDYAKYVVQFLSTKFKETHQ